MNMIDLIEDFMPRHLFGYTKNEEDRANDLRMDISYINNFHEVVYVEYDKNKDGVYMFECRVFREDGQHITNYRFVLIWNKINNTYAIRDNGSNKLSRSVKDKNFVYDGDELVREIFEQEPDFSKNVWEI